ncbi:unnamed protein product, partial [marine sediment metagenome]
RRLIHKNQSDWKNLVPDPVAKFINDPEILKRIKIIYENP